jgi:hypothetical protein
VQPRLEAIFFRAHEVGVYFLDLDKEPVLFANLTGDLKVQSKSKLGTDTYAQNVIFDAIFPDWVQNRVRIGKFWTRHGKKFKLPSWKSANTTFWLEAKAIPEDVIAQVLDEEWNSTHTLHLGLAGFGEVIVDWMYTKVKMRTDCWFHVNGSILEENSFGDLYDDEESEASENSAVAFSSSTTSARLPLDASEMEDDVYYYEKSDMGLYSSDVMGNESAICAPASVGRHRRWKHYIDELLNHTYRLDVIEQFCHYSLNNIEFFYDM